MAGSSRSCRRARPSATDRLGSTQGSRTMTRHRVTRRRLTTTWMVAAAVLTPLALAGCAGDDASREPVDMIPVLAATQTSQDEIPSAPDAEGLGVRPDTTRSAPRERHRDALGRPRRRRQHLPRVVARRHGTLRFVVHPAGHLLRPGDLVAELLGEVRGSTSLLVPSDVDLAPVDVTVSRVRVGVRPRSCPARRHDPRPGAEPRRHGGRARDRRYLRAAHGILKDSTGPPR